MSAIDMANLKFKAKMTAVKAYLATLFFAVILIESSLSQELKTRISKTSESDLSIDMDWWKTAVLYQIYPRSFKDSNNDGNGDLQGIIQKLDHLQDMGVDAIWLSPVYKSPQVDNGYDISDYRDIDPMFGTLEDLNELIDKAHKLNIKVLVDYVPNHTSDKHKWFQASLKRDPQYDEYYVWRNATYMDGERKPPNNWISWFKGSAWEWNEDRQQYYLHQFSTGQPDLNYRNPNVVEDMKDVLRYWLNFGVDGFRMDAVGTLFEDISLRDEPESGTPGLGPDDPGFLKHIYILNQPETFDMIYQWREVLDEFTTQNNTYARIMVTEGDVNDPDIAKLYYASADGSRMGAHFTFNFLSFFLIHKNYTASDLTDSIQTWFDNIPAQFTSNWVLGNHDQTRVATRLGVENIDPLNMLASILPGVQVTYQGEEIGEENGEVTCEEGYDPQAIKNCSTFDLYSRDFERTPFQWDNSINAGFNEGNKTWLPVSEKYLETNLALQNDPTINSHYNIYKELLQLRQEFRNSSNNLIFYGMYSSQIFYVQRNTDHGNYALFYNVGDSEDIIEFPVCTDCMTVTVRSTNSEYKSGDVFNVSQPLKPREAVLNKITISLT